MTPTDFLVLFLIIPSLGGAQNSCLSSSCSADGPTVRFPFWLKGRQPKNCGYPGFELSCTEKNHTLFNLSSSGQFLVEYISYSSQELGLRDPEGCLAKRLITLNLTGSPFMEVGFSVCTLLNCSASNERLFPIPCLSSHTSYVYATYASSSVSPYLSSCRHMANIKTTRMDCYGVDESEVGFGLDLLLHWTLPGCNDCEKKERECGFKSNNSLEVGCFNIPPAESPDYYDHYYPYQDEANKKFPIHIILGVGFSILFLTLTGAFSMFYWKSKWEKARENQRKIKKFLKDCEALNPIRYSYADVKRMTNEFNRKLGQGGYGSVFKGELENGVPIAVKVLNNSKGNGEDFTNEISTIGRIHHVNVVCLLGYCADKAEQALIYEYMPNGSLDKFIFPENTKTPRLGWQKFQDIAIGVAQGIEYLHQGCDQRILHFDIKPQNILLDHNFNPKISDFGLAKLFSKKDSIVSVTAVRGTMGYIAPEVYFFGNSGNVSYKSDVYSFGMLLLEMVGGRKNRDSTVEHTSQVYFPQWVYIRLEKGEDLGIKEEKGGDAEIAKKLAIVALWCIQWYPVNRPSMKVVIQMLEGTLGSLTMPVDPFASLSPMETGVAIP